MNDSPSDDHVLGRASVAASVGFGFGFVVTAAAGVYVLVRYLIPADGWWALGAVVSCVLGFPFLAGVAAAVAAMSVTNGWHRRGSRTAPDLFSQDEPLATSNRPRRAPRYYVRRFKPVIVAFLLLVPVAGAVVTVAPNRHYPFAAAVVVWHALLCNVIMLVARPVGQLLRRLGVARRLQLRAGMFELSFGLWSAAFVIGWVVVSTRR